MGGPGLITREQLRPRLEAAAQHIGKAELLRYLDGERLTPTESIRAHCFDCMAYFEDCAEDEPDCKNTPCPLYPFMPYRGNGGDGAREAP